MHYAALGHRTGLPRPTGEVSGYYQTRTGKERMKPRDYLKKVMSAKSILMGTDLTSRGDTITMTNHYSRKLRLECGHILWRCDSAKVPARAVCKKCWELQLPTTATE